MNIYKELLSEVLECEVAHISQNFNEINIYEKSKDNPFTYNASSWLSINTYELAHKCKEWAYEQGYSICTTPHSIEAYAKSTEKGTGKHKTLWRRTADVNSFSLTPKYVFEICDAIHKWILEKKN
jgi:hypothetical protein